MFIPIWVIAAFSCVLMAFIIENFRQRAKMKQIVDKAETLYSRINVTLPAGSAEAVQKAKWNLAFQLSEQANQKLHEDIARMRERGH